jgi:hydroxypyruvate reductase
VSGAERLRELYLAIAARLDGATLVKEARAEGTHVLALGKVAGPMFEGCREGLAARPALLVCPAQGAAPLVRGARVVLSDHPQPSERSVSAAREVLQLLAGLTAADRLLVLLSGGGSSLLAAPARGLTLEDKRETVALAASAGASIAQLNTIRKHLSAVKGGQLALACAAPITVLALSDVVGDDPATIASGPFSPDPTTYAEALALVRALAPGAPPPAIDHLARGAAGEVPETPKPGDRRLDHVSYRIIAGPGRAAAEAERVIATAGLAAGVLARQTEEPVPALAALYGERARGERAAGGAPRVLIGNGEPSIALPPAPGRGGRSTHLALLMAREIAGLTGVAFLAAGTDERDGNSDGCGAVVDGGTWRRASEAGLAPERALERADSASVLGALGAMVRGPGRSNLLDLHLLAVGAPDDD